MADTPALPLANEFPAATESDWRALVDGVLKGAPFEKRLMPKTSEGLSFKPLLPRRVGAEVIAGARGTSTWATHARVDHPDPAEANALLLADLDGGASAVSLVFGPGHAARGFGLGAPTADLLAETLRGVHCDLVAIRMEASPHHGRGAAKAMMAFAKANRLPGASLDVDFGLAPLVFQALSGSSGFRFSEAMAKGRAIIDQLRDEGFRGPFFRADGRPFHDAGAGDSQELGLVLAQAVSILRGLSETAFAPEEAAAAIGFTLAIDQDQFAGIAKIRALRLLWARVEAVLGLTPRAIPIHAETSFRMMTRRDPQVNILRATIAAFAAATGGADSLCVLPFTQANGLPNAAARRLARNTSLILAEEANLYRMVDPVAGAGAIEAMTDGLAEAAWSVFQQIEAERAEGEQGMPAALRTGMIAGHIAATRAARQNEIATRRWPITGTSEFPDMGETPPDVLAQAPVEVPSGDFPAIRLSHQFEFLRDRADALAAAGDPPTVFLANLGVIADFTARATFAKNAYAAGGIKVITNDGFAEDMGTNLVALTDAFKASGARLACICASDALYAEEAADAAIALMASGADAVHLAGRPGELEPALRAAGVSEFLAFGMDLPVFLARVVRGADHG